MGPKPSWLFFECGDIADRLARFLCLEQAPHDLAASRFGQLRNEFEFRRSADRTEVIAHVFLGRSSSFFRSLTSCS